MAGNAAGFKIRCADKVAAEHSLCGPRASTKWARETGRALEGASLQAEERGGAAEGQESEAREQDEENEGEREAREIFAGRVAGRF